MTGKEVNDEQTTNPYRFNITPTLALSTHTFEWRPGSIHFVSYAGRASPPLPGAQFHSWMYSGSDVPPEGGGNARINLWLYNGQPPSDGQSIEVVIDAFEYHP